jgi:hypothetical protein
MQLGTPTLGLRPLDPAGDGSNKQIGRIETECAQHVSGVGSEWL